MGYILYNILDRDTGKYLGARPRFSQSAHKVAHRLRARGRNVVVTREVVQQCEKHAREIAKHIAWAEYWRSL